MSNNGWNDNFKIRKGELNKISPCKECTERHPACHSDCERFKEWKAAENKSKHEYMNKYYCDKYFEHQQYRRQDVKMAEKHQAANKRVYERKKAGKVTALKEGKK